MTAHLRLLPHRRRIGMPFGAGFVVLLTLLFAFHLKPSSAMAQCGTQLCDDCWKVHPFPTQLVQVVAGTDPEWPTYDTGAAGGWTVPGGVAALPVWLDNRAVVGSVRTFLTLGGVPDVGSHVGVETTERTHGFQLEWTLEGNQLEVYLFSTSGAVIERGVGPIYRVIYQVNSDVENGFNSLEAPDILQVIGAGFAGYGWGGESIVLDPNGQSIPWCGAGFNPVVPRGGGVLVMEPAAVIKPATVIGFAPTYSQTNTNIHTNVTATFSEDVLPATVNGSTFTLTGGSREVTGAVTLSGRTVTLDPYLPLEFGTLYTARTQGIQDLEGNPVSSGVTTWTFRTGAAITGIEPVPAVPSVAASPNPFGVETSIAYGVPTAGRVNLRVYSTSGRLIRTLADSEMPAGTRLARWDGRDSDGKQVGSGIYFLRFAASGMAKTQRLMLLR